MNNDTKQIFKCIGRRIQYIQKLQDMTDEKLSSRTGIPTNRIKQWHSGEYDNIPATDMPLLAKALSVDMDYLFSYKIDETIELGYLRYLISQLPADMHHTLSVLLLYYINQEITYHDFWDSVIDTLGKDNEDYIKLLKKELDEEESN